MPGTRLEAPSAGEVCVDKGKVIIPCWSIGQRERPVQLRGPDQSAGKLSDLIQVTFVCQCESWDKHTGPGRTTS